ncbi:callose synthase 11 [Quercus suber]|uniref:Callose synthase 11 n=1 Tax=Quercus suber TaxID=58331 RepID=A0AAW0KZQ9_QUESU
MDFSFFHLGSAHYFGHTIMQGGAKYRATRHGFVIRHKSAGLGGQDKMAIYSWKIWWYEGQEHLKSINIVRRVARIILALCFFAIQYGFAELVT